MLGIMLQKLWHKKWMVVCLLLGCVLLTATVVCFPLYRNAAYDRMLQDEFDNYLKKNGVWPGINSMLMVSKKDANGKSMRRMEELTANIYNELGVSEKLTIIYYSLAKTDAHSLMDRGEREGKFSLRPGYLKDLPEHARVLAGSMYSETGIADDGAIELVVSESALVSQNFLVGETIEFDNLKDDNGKPLRARVVGVFDEADKSDFYWQVTPDSLKGACLMNENVFQSLFCGEKAGKYTITCNYFALMDYTTMSATKADFIKDKLQYLLTESSYRSTLSEPAYGQIINTYLSKRTRIDATLFILQIPVLIMLGAFLIMIAGQMYDMERNEISVIKSRGASGAQIFRLYLYQSIFLSVVGSIGGLPLGTLFCRLLGSSDNFLQFNFSRSLRITYTKDVFIYLGAAVAVCIFIMTVPAIKHSKVTIVKLKQQKAARMTSLWERFFLDFIFLGIAIYGFYNYSSNSAAVTEKVLKGEAMDPLLYISSSLFILGAGMLMLRMQRFLVMGIYHAGKKWWGPAACASFMETIKNGRKQQFIVLFMILTISLGIFHATVARTILQNARENAEYLDGTDLVIREAWKNNSSMASQSGDNFEFHYYEPDYSKYAAIGGTAGYTKVLMDDKANLRKSSKELYPITVMGIHTKEFGENTQLDAGLLEKPYYSYLNELALQPNGLLVSSNMRGDFQLKVGDTIEYVNGDGARASGTIIDFVDYWPGYQPTTMLLNTDGNVINRNNYLIIANLASLQRYWGVTPYQVWITLKEDKDTEPFYSWIKEYNVPVKTYTDKKTDVDEVIKDPLLQGTNGILTLGFIVTIILCAVGYLIYWIMSIRSREMIFGVLRACGLHKGEIFFMLILEQIFSGIFSIFAGILIGRISSDMYVPILQNSYAVANQVLPMKLITNAGDLIRLYGVIAGVMVLCLLVITVIVFKLNVAKALKLGEE